MSDQPGGFDNPSPTAAPANSRQALIMRQRELEQALSRSRQANHRIKRQAAEAAAMPPGEGEEESWLMTYLDVMTLLLVMLVVMLAFAGKGDGLKNMQGIMNGLAGQNVMPKNAGILETSGNEVPTPQTQSQAPKKDPLEGLPLDKLGKDIDVVVNEGTVSFRISSEILFSSGQAELSLDGLRVLRQLVPVLNGSSHQIAVVGHTDAIPIRSTRFPSNWELSSARAGSVVRYLESNGVASNRLRAVGYADTRPLADNASAEGRATNRRVELIMETPQ